MSEEKEKPMAEPQAPIRSGNTMKIVAIALGVVAVALVVVVAVLASQLGSKNSKLNDADQQVESLQTQVDNLQSNLSTTQGNLTTAQAEAASLKTDLDQSNTQVKSLQAQIDSLDENVANQQTMITDQAAQIQTMSYPRNFNSIVELTNWLQQDNTDTIAAGLTNPEIAFILQIHAARDGYLLPVRLPIAGSLDYITNMAVIGDVVYSVRGKDDFVERWGSVSPALPSYPIQPGSGQ